MLYQRSPLKIQGNKFALLSQINSVISTSISSNYNYDVWVEAFTGSGTVGFNLANGPASFFDVNPHIIGFFNAIKAGDIVSDDVRKILRHEQKAFKQKGAERYYEIREKFNKTPDPLTFFLLNKTSFNGIIRFNKAGGFNTPYCKNDNRITDSLIEQSVKTIEELSKKISKWGWEFLLADFGQAVDFATSERNPLLFLDPPYIERNPTYYTIWSKEDEERLFQSLLSSKLPFLLTTWIRNKQSTHVNTFFETLWSKHFSFSENEHTYIINGTKKEIDSVKIKEAIVYGNIKGLV